MNTQAFNPGDMVSIQGQVISAFDGKLKVQVGFFEDTFVFENEVQKLRPLFEPGDQVVLDTGEPAVILGIYREVAWIFSDNEGFETVDFSELRRPNACHLLANAGEEV